jgi:hypothetical protein
VALVSRGLCTRRCGAGFSTHINRYFGCAHLRSLNLIVFFLSVFAPRSARGATSGTTRTEAG